jgi:hypothetical protein
MAGGGLTIIYVTGGGGTSHLIHNVINLTVQLLGAIENSSKSLRLLRVSFLRELFWL